MRIPAFVIVSALGWAAAAGVTTGVVFLGPDSSPSARGPVPPGVTAPAGQAPLTQPPRPQGPADSPPPGPTSRLVVTDVRSVSSPAPSVSTAKTRRPHLDSSKDGEEKKKERPDSGEKHKGDKDKKPRP